MTVSTEPLPSSAEDTPAHRSPRATHTADLLGRAFESPGPQERFRLVEEVVVLNMPVARSIARRFRHKGIGDDDLDQVAYLALTRAAQQFDPRHGRDFLTYAVPTIRGELKKYFRDHGWMVRPPRRVQELQARIVGARAELSQTLGRSPRPREVAEHLEEPLDDVVAALATDGCFAPSSLDKPVGEDARTTVGELLDDDAHDLAAAEARLLLAPLINRLSSRDRRIVDMRFWRDATQQEIADDIGVTQMHVSRLISRILGELHDELSEDETATTHACG